MTENTFTLAPPIEEAINAEVDMFGRDKFRDGLINLFKNSANPLVVALDEPWGTGKTVFVRRLQNKINEEEVFQAIYFDAFENDHEEDVFIAIASEFLSILQPSEKAEEVKEKAKQVGKVLGRVFLKGGLRLVTAGIVRTGDISESSEEIANEVSDQFEAELDQLIDQKLNNFAKDKLVFKSFRTAIANYATDKPIVFIIDELDRCRPDYALSVLETIKHFFTVDGVHFLLVSNSKSLIASVENQYGKINGFEYLQKFINLRLSFPNLDEYEYRKSCEKFVSFLLNDIEIINVNRDAFNTLWKFLVEQLIDKKYSLRDVEKYVALLKISLLFAKDKKIHLVAILALLIDMKLFAPDLYVKVANNTLGYNDIVKRYGYDANITPKNRDTKDWFAIWWRLFLEYPDGEEWDEIKRRIEWDYDLRVGDTSKPIRGIANEVLDAIVT